ncbi:MAG TPA: tyrosine--tRNA ligase, partial [Clostridia bacterium]|nr:tyrosine--tRNA ligase [Clostridia bacterium]
KTSPYDFYQYWRNVDDADVKRCLQLLTFIPLDEIAELCAYNDERINNAKRRLAFELTSMVHGNDEAQMAQSAAEAAFYGGNEEDMPSFTLKRPVQPLSVVELLYMTGVASSKSDARRLIAGGGVSINDARVDSVDAVISDELMDAGAFIVHKGKKVHLRIVVEN